MRPLSILCLCGIALGGCHAGTASSPSPSATAQITLEKPCPPSIDPAVDQWLRERRELCELSVEQRKAQFQRIESRRAHHSLRDHLQKLALASCQPELTPGLLRQALSDAENASTLAPEQRELLALISALDQSTRILETRNEQLKTELEKTINGIRDIEADMDDIHQQNGDR